MVYTFNDDLPPELEAEFERIWQKYSIDGKLSPQLFDRACEEFEAALVAHGYSKPN